MKKQYLAKIQHRYQEKTGDWSNAMALTTSNRRFAESYEEAKAVVDKLMKEFNKGARVERSTAGGIGVATHITADDANRLEIVRWEILEREVSEWQKVSE